MAPNFSIGAEGMPVFIDVEYLRGWCLFVVLSDGVTGVLDLTLAPPALFARHRHRATLRPCLHQSPPPVGVARRLHPVGPGGLPPDPAHRRARRLPRSQMRIERGLLTR